MPVLANAASWFLFLHFAGIILWLGPTLGGYYMYLQARSQALRCEHVDLPLWTLKQFMRLTRIEHIGLVMLITGGFGRMGLGGWRLSETPWLQYKLLIFFLVIMVLELADLYMTEWMLRRALSSDDAWRISRAIKAYDCFLSIGVVVLLFSLPPIFVLAIFKP